MQQRETIWNNQRQNDDFSGILSYHVPTSATRELIQYIHLEDRAEGKVVCFFGYPGIGKTATCVHAARSTNSLYIRFPLSESSLTKSIDVLLQRLYPAFFVHVPKASVDKIIQFISDVTNVVMCQLFSNATQISFPFFLSQEQKDQVVITQNGIPTNFTYEQLADAERRLKATKHADALMAVTNSKNILIHLDECQAWAVDAKFDMSSNKETIYTEYTNELDNYRLIGMSKCLASMCTTLPKTTLVMSGTNIDCGTRIVVDAQIKAANVSMLMYSTSSFIAEIVNHYCDLSHLSQEELMKKYNKLVGPTRLVQCFLRALFHKTYNIPKNTVTVDTIDSAIQSSYQDFNQVTLQHANVDQTCCLCNIVTILWEYPHLRGGTIGTLTAQKQWSIAEQPDSFKVIRYKRSVIPLEYLTFEDSGTARWVDDGEYKYIVAPFPMLKQLWDSRKDMYFSKEDIDLLYSWIRNATPKGAHNNAFQIAVCTVLTRPDSELFKFVTRQKYFPTTQHYKLALHKSEKELTDVTKVYMLIDCETPRDVENAAVTNPMYSKDTMADIVLHVVDDDRIKRVRISVKMNTNSTCVSDSIETLRKKYPNDLCLLITFYDIVRKTTEENLSDHNVIYKLTKLREGCSGKKIEHDFDILDDGDSLLGLSDTLRKLTLNIQPENIFDVLSKIDVFKEGLGIAFPKRSLYRYEDYYVEEPPTKKRKKQSIAAEWSLDEVGIFLQERNLESFVQKFKAEQIGGEALLLLDVDLMIKHLNMPVGHAVLLNKAITKLKSKHVY